MRIYISIVLLMLAAPNWAAAGGPNATSQMIHATYKLVNPGSTATCILVSRPDGKDTPGETVLVTAAHVLQQISGDEATLVLRKANQDGTYARQEMKLKVRSKGKQFWTKHPTVDLAVLPVRLPKNTSASPLPLSALLDEAGVKTGRIAPGDDVRIACYPVRFEINAAAFPVIRRGAIAGFPLFPIKAHHTFLVDYNNFPGDSGGPVYVTENKAGVEKPLVIGLVLGQHLYDERTKLAFEERVLRHRMGLAIIVHAEFVRQAIELLPRTTATGE